jgi:hypothetical protein
VKSRRYAIFDNGYDKLLGGDTFIGPEKVELYMAAFYNFYVKYYMERRDCCCFAAPTILGQDPREVIGGFTLLFWATSSELPEFNKERILRKLYPEIEDIWEVLDENLVTFERIWHKQKIENLARGY